MQQGERLPVDAQLARLASRALVEGGRLMLWLVLHLFPRSRTLAAFELALDVALDRVSDRGAEGDTATHECKNELLHLCGPLQVGVEVTAVQEQRDETH